MINSQKQTGSAHVVIVIIVVVAIISALGFVVWQNLNKDDSSETTVQKVETKDGAYETQPQIENETFENNELSFEYPGTGWKVVTPIGPDGITALETDDYKPSMGMGLDSGAGVTVYYTNQQEVTDFPGTKDVQEIKVDGYKGYRYALEYEGYRLQAFFTIPSSEGDTNYGITMQTVGPATAEEIEAFDMILNTFDVK